MQGHQQQNVASVTSVYLNCEATHGPTSTSKIPPCCGLLLRMKLVEEEDRSTTKQKKKKLEQQQTNKQINKQSVQLQVAYRNVFKACTLRILAVLICNWFRKC